MRWTCWSNDERNDWERNGFWPLEFAGHILGSRGLPGGAAPSQWGNAHVWQLYTHRGVLLLCCTSHPKSGPTLTVGSGSYRSCPNPALELSPLLLPLFQQELKPRDHLGDITPHMLLIEVGAGQNIDWFRYSLGKYKLSGSIQERLDEVLWPDLCWRLDWMI